MTYAGFQLITSFVNFISSKYPDVTPTLTKKEMYEKELTGRLLAIFSKVRSECKILSILQPTLTCTLVLRESKSWKTVDTMLDQVKINPANSNWWWNAKKIVAMAFHLGQKLKTTPDSPQTMLDTIHFIKEFPSVYANTVPSDCSGVASYIKTHVQALLLFTNFRDASLDEDCTFVEILTNAPVQHSTDTIRGVFEVQEMDVDKISDPTHPQETLMRSRKISCISNAMYGPQNLSLVQNSPLHCEMC